MTNSISFNYKNYFLEVAYDLQGNLEFVRDVIHNKKLIIETQMSGAGYEIKKETLIFGCGGVVCDARYVKISELNIFIPRKIFIVNNLEDEEESKF